MAQISDLRKLISSSNMKNWIWQSSYVCSFSLSNNEFYLILKIFLVKVYCNAGKTPKQKISRELKLQINHNFNILNQCILRHKNPMGCKLINWTQPSAKTCLDFLKISKNIHLGQVLYLWHIICQTQSVTSM